jgi:hypothetical protein
MKARPSLLIQVLLAGVIVVASGCGMPPKPMQFNNMLSRANKRLADPARKFYEAVIPLKENKEAKIKQAQSAYDEMRSALADVRSQFASARAPVSSPYGVELLAEYRDNFLKAQQNVFDTSITPMWKIVQGPGDPASKWNAIVPLLQKARDDETPSYNKLRAWHKEYCKDHNLEAKGNF